jgi:thiol-disulfide isomerase/thioredoxin
MRSLPSVLPAAVVVLAVLAVLAGAPAPARAGIAFRGGPLDDTLAVAKKEKARVFVEVYATWCGPCKRQAAEVFDTPAGEALTKGLVPWRVDFDAPDVRPLMERWNILSLPTVLVLRPDGTEVDRIEGYETREAFLADAARLVKGQDQLPVLEKKLLVEKDPAERLRLMVEVGHKKLVRDDPAGPRLLERAITEDQDGKAGAAEEALFLVGRHLSRVKKDFATAKHVWRELLMRFPDGKYEGTAAWWYAGALHELKEDALALGLLERRARQRPDEDRLDALVSFAVEKGAGKDTAALVLDDLEKAGRVDAAVLAQMRARLASPSGS